METAADEGDCVRNTRREGVGKLKGGPERGEIKREWKRKTVKEGRDKRPVYFTPRPANLQIF